MKKIIVVLLLLITMFSLCSCAEEDYSKTNVTSDYMITEYYTHDGDLYQTVTQDRKTRITIITTYYWKNDNGRTYLDKIEVIRINEKGEIVS